MRAATPYRAFAHPLWIVALFTLAANDHLFKVSGPFPPWLTGKLSDFAGLLVAPFVLAALFQAKTRLAIALAHGAIAIVFAAIKLSAEAARGFEALTALTPFPWHAIQVDPTDLTALPMVWLSWAIFLPWAERAHPASLWAKAALIPGAIACAATAPQPERGPFPTQTVFPPVEAMLTIANATDRTIVVRTRRLKDDVQVDCAVAASDPGAMFGREAFDLATIWTVDANRAVPLEELSRNRLCEAFLIDGDDLPPRIVFWQAGELQLSMLPSTASDSTPDRTIFVRDGLVWEEHPRLHAHRVRGLEAATEGCAVGSRDPRVEWADPVPFGPHRITRLEETSGGCWVFDLEKDEQPFRWYACVEQIDLPFAEGMTIELSLNAPSSLGRTLVITGTTARVMLETQSRPREQLQMIESCGGFSDSCGNVAIPARLQVGAERSLAAGESFDDLERTVHVVRAEQVVVSGGRCGARETLPIGARYETVTVELLGGR